MGILRALKFAVNPFWAASELGLNALAKKPRAIDPRLSYKPTAATFGSVIPPVYGTTRVPTPALMRGLLEVSKDAWKQHHLALLIGQGPISSVRTVYVSDANTSQPDRVSSVPWSRMVECGASLCTGTLTGHTAYAQAFIPKASKFASEGDHEVVAKSGKLVIRSGVQRSFLPLLSNVTQVQIPAGTVFYRADGAVTPVPTYVLGGTYNVTSISETEIVLTNPGAVNSAWNLLVAGVPYVPVLPWSITATAGGLYYPGIAHIRANPLDLKALYSTLGALDNTSPQFSAEVVGMLSGAGPESLDAEAVDVIIDILGTNYWAANAIPSSRVEVTNGTGGTAASGARRYCQAQGFHVSGALDEQRATSAHLQSLLDSIDCEAVWSGGVLKILPYGDQSITANGVTYTPNTAPVYDLTFSDMLGQGDESPIEITPVSDALIYNTLPVEYRARSAGGDPYRIAIEQLQDVADIEENGARVSSPLSLHWITNATHAQKIARLHLSRMIYVRNTYAFRLGWRFAMIEPMDLVTLTDPILGLDHHVVRVLSVEKSEDGGIRVEAVDWPIGMASATLFATQSSDSYVPQPVGVGPYSPAAADLSNVATSTVQQSQLVPHAITDNLWPNANSERNPPAGADLTSAEWGWRYGGDAWTPSTVYAVTSRVTNGGKLYECITAGTSATSGGPTGTGSDITDGTAHWAHLETNGAYAGFWRRLHTAGGAQEHLTHIVPCSPGDSFHIEAMVAAAGGYAGVFLFFVDRDGTLIASGTGSYQSNSGTWTKCSCSGTAPAGAVAVWLRLFVNATVTGAFDAIYARRKLSGLVQNFVKSFQRGFFNLEPTEAVVFANYGAEDQPDTNYSVALTPVGYTGTPPEAAFIPKLVGKDTDAIYVTLRDAPGNGNSVVFDVLVFRTA